MNKKLRMAGLATAVAALLIADVAEAQLGGSRRRTRRRTAVVVSSTTHAKDEQEEQAAVDKAVADQKAADQAAADKAAADKAAAGPLPVGMVVTSLPPGCAYTPIDGQAYYQCGGNTYRAVFQENNLVYVTTPPPAPPK